MGLSLLVNTDTFPGWVRSKLRGAQCIFDSLISIKRLPFREGGFKSRVAEVATKRGDIVVVVARLIQRKR